MCQYKYLVFSTPDPSKPNPPFPIFTRHDVRPTSKKFSLKLTFNFTIADEQVPDILVDILPLRALECKIMCRNIPHRAVGIDRLLHRTLHKAPPAGSINHDHGVRSEISNWQIQIYFKISVFVVMLVFRTLNKFNR